MTAHGGGGAQPVAAGITQVANATCYMSVLLYLAFKYPEENQCSLVVRGWNQEIYI